MGYADIFFCGERSGNVHTELNPRPHRHEEPPNSILARGTFADIRDNLGGGATTLPFYLDPEKVTFAEMAVRFEEYQ